MRTLIIAIVAVLVILPLLRYVGFFLSNSISGDLAEVRKKGGPLWSSVLRGVATSILAEPMAVLGSMGVFLAKREPNGKGTPIILVHGLYHNTTAWCLMRRRLERAGYANIHTYGYNSFTRDFEAAVVGLLRTLDKVLATNPGNRPILIGHSLGGCVARAAAGNPQYRDRIAGLVALGSPHGGSDLAWLGGNRMARDLIPGRHIQRSLERLPDPDCPKLAIYTLTDDFVYPLTALKPGREEWREQVCSPMGHVWMLYSKEIVGRIIRFLER